MDEGEFIFESEGIMWAAALGTENYNNLEQAGMDIWNSRQGSQRWSVYRYGNRQHNTLTFNGLEQRVNGMATFTQVEKDFPGSATLDLSPTYEGQAARVVRRCSLSEDRSLMVEDHIETLPGQQTELTWTLVTTAEVKQTRPQSLQLSSKGKKMGLNVEGISRLRWDIGPATPPHEFENQNQGYTIIRFTTQLTPSSITNLRVTLSKN